MKTKETQKRAAYDKFIKKGLSILVKEDNVKEPESNVIKCSLMNFDDKTDMKAFDKMSYADCKIVSITSPSGKTEIHNLLTGDQNIPFSEMGFGLLDRPLFDKYYPIPSGTTQETLVKQFDGTKNINGLLLFTRKVKEQSGEYVDKLYAFKFQEDYRDYFQSVVVNDLLVTEDLNLLPDFPFKEVDVHMIDDETRTFAMEPFLKDQFTEKFIGVKGTSNYFLDLTKDKMDLLNNQMQFNNKTKLQKMKIVADKLDFVDEDNVVADAVFTKKIYQCAVFHNVVPFSLNPLDNSWCGFAFPQGERSEVTSITVKTIYIKKKTTNRDCVFMARSLQKTIQELCSNDNEELHNKIFSSENANKENKSGQTGDEGDKKKDEIEGNDKDMKHGEGKISYTGDASQLDDLVIPNIQEEKDFLHSVPVQIKERVHGASLDQDVHYKLDKVLQSLLLNMPELEPKIYQTQELMTNHVHNLRYHPNYIESDVQLKMFGERINETGKDMKFKMQIPIQKTDGTIVEMYRPEKTEKGWENFDTNSRTVRALNLNRDTDKTFSNHDIIEGLRFWQHHLSSHSINELKGRGMDLKQSEIFQNALTSMMDNSKPNTKLSKKAGKSVPKTQIFDQLWYRLQVDKKKGIVRKMYKTNGRLNGDVLEQKYDCCAILSTDKGAIVVKICKNVMVVSSKSEKKQFTVYGAEATEKDFKAADDNCGPPPDPNADKMDIKALKGTIVIPNFSSIPEKNNVTTIKDGQIIMDDGKTKISEQIDTLGTSVDFPEGKVDIQPSPDMTVKEKVQDNEGNVTSEKILDADDETILKDDIDEAPIDALCATLPEGPKKVECKKTQELIAAGILPKTPEAIQDGIVGALPEGMLPETQPGALPGILPETQPGILPETQPGALPGILPETQPKSPEAAALAAAIAAQNPNEVPINPQDPVNPADPANPMRPGAPASPTNPKVNPSNPPNNHPKPKGQEGNSKEESESQSIDDVVGKPSARPKAGEKQEIQVSNNANAPDGVIVRDLGQQDIYIDRENKVTVHSKKDGSNKDKLEKVVNAYRLGDLVYIQFDNGSQLKHYLVTGETVKIYNDKNTIAHFQPDNSYVLDDRSSKLRHINNKQGVKATFDLEGNKFLNKDVKQQFRQGADVVQVMKDDTVIVKKANGESVILNPDESLQVLNKQGKVDTHEDYRFKVRYNLNQFNKDNTDKYIKVFDKLERAHFMMYKMSKLTRKNGMLFEVLPNKIKLQIVYAKKNQQKLRSTKTFEERCYPNKWGIRYNEMKSDAYLCRCNDRFIVDNWSCEHNKSRAAVFEAIIKELKRKRLWNQETDSDSDKYNQSQEFMRMIRDKWK